MCEQSLSNQHQPSHCPALTIAFQSLCYFGIHDEFHMQNNSSLLFYCIAMITHLQGFFLSPTPTHLFLPNFFSIKTFRILLLSSWVWIMVLSFKMLTFLYHQTSYFSLLQLFAALDCLKSHNWCPSEKAIVNYIIYKHI